MSFEDAVLTLRYAWIQESGFSRLKGKSLGASPLFVQKDDQAKGLMHLLSLGLRILTLLPSRPKIVYGYQLERIVYAMVMADFATTHSFAGKGVIEFVVQRRLKQQNETLFGLFPRNPKRATARPTTERILRAFKDISLTILGVKDEEYGHVSPLTSLQQRIVELLSLAPDVYSSLESSTDEA